MTEPTLTMLGAKRELVHFYVFADSDVTNGDEDEQTLLDDKLTAAFINLRRRYESDQLSVGFFDGSGVNDFFDIYLPGFAVSTRSLRVMLSMSTQRKIPIAHGITVDAPVRACVVVANVLGRIASATWRSRHCSRRSPSATSTVTAASISWWPAPQSSFCSMFNDGTGTFGPPVRYAVGADVVVVCKGANLTQLFLSAP